MSNFKAIQTELIEFFKAPKEIDQSDDGFGVKLNFWFKILAIDFLFSFVITVIMSIASELGLFDAENHEVMEMMKSMTPIGFMFTAVILLPFIEEVIFRLPLRYKSNIILRGVEWFSVIFGKNVKMEVRSAFESIYAKYFKILFYTSAIFFALLHIMNYQFSFSVLLLFPLLILPQLLFGMFGGFVRLKLGFFWGASLHFAHNLIFLSVPLIMMMSDKEGIFENDDFQTFHHSTENVSIQIEETGIGFFGNKHAQFSADSLSFEGYGLNEIISMLLDVNQELIKFEEAPYSQKLRLDCKAKVLKDSIDLNKELLALLQSHYHFKISQKTSVEKGLELYIADTVKFTQNTKASSNDAYSAHTYTSFDKITMSNVNIKELAESLSTNLNLPVSFTGSSKRRIDISYKTGSTDEIKKVLFEKLGLKFKEIEQEHSYYAVEGA
jgi:membrane protease YdiL (CAAX protease family)